MLSRDKDDREWWWTADLPTRTVGLGGICVDLRGSVGVFRDLPVLLKHEADVVLSNFMVLYWS